MSYLKRMRKRQLQMSPPWFVQLSKVHECKRLTNCIYEVTQKRRSDGILWELHNKLMWLLHHYLLSSDASLLHEANIAEEIKPSLDYTNLCYHPLKTNKQKIVLHIGHHDLGMHWSVDTEWKSNSCVKWARCSHSEEDSAIILIWTVNIIRFKNKCIKRTAMHKMNDKVSLHEQMLLCYWLWHSKRRATGSHVHRISIDLFQSGYPIQISDWWSDLPGTSVIRIRLCAIILFGLFMLLVNWYT